MTEPSRLDRILEQGSIFALAGLRVAVGLIMTAHGWAKLCNVAGTAVSFGSLGIPAPHVLVYLVVAAEFIGGLGLAAGLLTRVAALGPLVVMVVAILTVHLGHGLFAKDGGYEYPLILLCVSTFFAFNGAGAFSMDAWYERAARERESRAPELRHDVPARSL